MQSDVTFVRQRAMDLLRAGRFSEAKAACMPACQANPSDSEGWSLLAAIHAQLGENADVEVCCRRVVQLKPNDAAMRYNLGVALQAQERHAEALECYRHALVLAPEYAEAWCNLGLAELRLARPQDAVESCRRALGIKANLVEAHDNIGLAYIELGRFSEASAHFQESLRLAPGIAKAHFNLGLCNELAGQTEEARTSYERAIRLDPKHAEAFYRIGRMLSEQAVFEEAEAYIRHAVELKPDYPDGLIGLGSLIAARASGAADFMAARDYLSKARSIRPLEPNVFLGLARLAQLEGKYAEAMAHYDRALALKPDYPEAVAGKVSVLERMGQTEQGRAIIEPFMRSDDVNSSLALANAALARDVEQRRTAVRILTMSVEREKTRGMRIDIHFALGKLLDELGEYDSAFMNFEKANALDTGQFDAEKNAAWFDRIMQVYGASRINQMNRAPNNDPRPIFIVGMPRSGTSLVEQIIASHPLAHGAGELTKINEITQTSVRPGANDANFPAWADAVDSKFLQTAANEYLDLIGALAGPDALRVTDKMPHNFVCLGLIQQLFPGARIIHCVRDPMDTCLSIYFEKFNKHHLYANNLEHLGIYYRQYLRLMEHWRSVLSLPVFELKYEDLVANQEPLTRQLINFCGLPWDERCLRFHEAERIVATPSYNQVKKPLYKKSVARWRHYERHLGKLKMQLGL